MTENANSKSEIFGWVAFFSFMAVISMIVAVTLWAVNQDYVLYSINNVSRNLENNSVMSSQMADDIEATGNEHADLINSFDNILFASYMIFFGFSIVFSYYSREDSEFEWLALLFYGTMSLLFLVAIISVFTNWFSSDLLYKLVPNLEGQFPKLDFMIENVGIICLIQLCIMFFVNKINLNMIRNRDKKQDVGGLDTGDIL